MIKLNEEGKKHEATESASVEKSEPVDVKKKKIMKKALKNAKKSAKEGSKAEEKGESAAFESTEDEGAEGTGGPGKKYKLLGKK